MRCCDAPALDGPGHAVRREGPWVTVIHVLGGVDWQGGMAAFVEQLTSAGQSGIRSLVWKHRDFRPPGGRAHVFLREGTARYTDRGLWQDVRAALADVPALWRRVRGERRVVLHAHSRMGMVASLAVRAFTRVPLVIHAHARPARPLVYRLLWRLAGAAVVFNSRRTCLHFGEAPERAVILMPPVPWPEAPAPASKPRFVAASVFVPWKNLDRILDAFACLRTRGLAMELIIFGASPVPVDPECQAAVIARASATPGASVRDYDLRWTEELRSTDVFVHAASHEPFGIAILEAFSRGCRLVVPGETFLDDLPEPTRSLGIFRAVDGTPEALEQAMLRAAGDSGSPAGRWAARMAVRPLFSVEHVTATLAATYRALLG